jgi:hypothetical protein
MFRFGRAKVQLKIRRDYCGNVPGAVLGLKAEPNGDWKHGFRRMGSFGKFVSTDEDLFVSRLKHHATLWSWFSAVFNQVGITPKAKSSRPIKAETRHAASLPAPAPWTRMLRNVFQDWAGGRPCFQVLILIFVSDSRKWVPHSACCSQGACVEC